ncbi:uncharacterized protein LOC135695746 [Rhopilema esculentum]|uniref:uncharacterized protein LOC135695746 n=1 Tax=Rhopilema esculentum TaxID=499914 RepID=UPI0031E35A63
MFDICLCLLRRKTKIVQCAGSKDKFLIFKPIKLGLYGHVNSVEPFFPAKRKKIENAMENTEDEVGIWTASKEEQLVDLWQEKACLYMVTSPEYSDRNKKLAALNEIATKLSSNVNQVKKRIASLRTQYARSRRIPSSGSARPKKMKKTQWIEDRLQFLSPYVSNRVSISNLQSSTESLSEPQLNTGDSDCDGDLDDNDAPAAETPVSTSRPLAAVKKSKTAKQKKEEEELSILKSLASSFSADENLAAKKDAKPSPSAAFGEYVTHALSVMDEKTRLVAMNNIQNAQMGSFSNEFNNPYHAGQHARMQSFRQSLDQQDMSEGPSYGQF